MHATFAREHEYKRHGTISLLAGIDLVTGKVHALVKDRHRSREFIEFLKLLDAAYPAHTAIKLILDNHSAHISKETKAWLADQPAHRFEFTFTPKHGSWLNLVEGFFSKLARSVLRHIRVASKQELKDRIMAAMDYFNQEPVVHTWAYKLDKAADMISNFENAGLVIAHPWARATPKGASTGAAYMTITNNGSVPDHVSCMSSDMSAECQIHMMAMENGVMKMRPVEGGLEIKPNETAAFKPSGLHLMLVRLKHPLEQGKTVSITLKFKSAGMVEVEYPIAGMGAAGSDGSADSNGAMTHEHGGTMQMNKH